MSVDYSEGRDRKNDYVKEVNESGIKIIQKGGIVFWKAVDDLSV